MPTCCACMHRVRASNQAWWAAGRSTFCSSDRSASAISTTAGPAVCRFAGTKPEVVFISHGRLQLAYTPWMKKLDDRSRSTKKEGMVGSTKDVEGAQGPVLPHCPAAQLHHIATVLPLTLLNPVLHAQSCAQLPSPWELRSDRQPHRTRCARCSRPSTATLPPSSGTQ